MCADVDTSICQQWLRAKCRRGGDCRFAHPPMQIAPLEKGYCQYLIGDWRRCVHMTQPGSDFCADHGPESAKLNSCVSMPVKRVSAKSRMLNPMSVTIVPQPITTLSDSSLPMIVDLGCARGLWLHTLALHQRDSGAVEPKSPLLPQGLRYNFVGFELRPTLVDAANRAAADEGTAGYTVFVPGDATGNIERCLFPLVSGGGTIKLLAIQFPDPWTKAKHRKRRIINDSFARSCTSVVSSGGLLYICSDRKDIAAEYYDIFSNICGSSGEKAWSATDELTSGIGATIGVDDDGVMRPWCSTRPFAVGTERDEVAEKTGRNVHRLFLCRTAVGVL